MSIFIIEVYSRSVELMALVKEWDRHVFKQEVFINSTIMGSFPFSCTRQTTVTSSVSRWPLSKSYTQSTIETLLLRSPGSTHSFMFFNCVASFLWSTETVTRWCSVSADVQMIVNVHCQPTQPSRFPFIQICMNGTSITTCHSAAFRRKKKKYTGVWRVWWAELCLSDWSEHWQLICIFMSPQILNEV